MHVKLYRFFILLEREVTAMERVMAYMKSVGLRPLELLRAFDKSAMINVSKKEFKNRLKVSIFSKINYLF